MVTIKPKRGGTHPIFGLYMGGDALDTSYKFVSGSSVYSSTSQLRSEKGLQVAESSLHNQRNNTTSLKFNGKLDVTSGETATLTELNMDSFIHSIADVVERFGLENLFYLPGPDGTMKYLPEEPHNFTLTGVLDEHKSRLAEPNVELDENGVETVESASARHRCYDEYEKCDFSLSRLAVDSLVHPDLRAEVITQHGHVPNFKKLPGQVYMMMTLDVCHASFAFKMEEAAETLNDLSLDSFPGENISKFANEAQRLIKIMQGGYSLPYQLGSTVLRKVCTTQSDYFNRSMFNLLDSSLSMERKHGPHKNPKLLESDPSYPTAGPVGVCTSMREFYGELVKMKAWPALLSTIPSGNLASTGSSDDTVLTASTGRSDTSSISPRKNFGGMRCHYCDSDEHFKKDCAKFKQSQQGGGSSTSTSNVGIKTIANPVRGWKFIHPPDDNSIIMVNDLKYFFCKHCVCKTTQRKGFYNRTHSSSGHTFPAATASPPAEVPNSAASTPSTVSGYHSSVTGTKLIVNPTSAVKDETKQVHFSDDVDPDPQGLQFTGAYLASNEAWMGEVDYVPDFDIQVGIECFPLDKDNSDAKVFDVEPVGVCDYMGFLSHVDHGPGAHPSVTVPAANQGIAKEEEDEVIKSNDSNQQSFAYSAVTSSSCTSVYITMILPFMAWVGSSFLSAMAFIIVSTLPAIHCIQSVVLMPVSWYSNVYTSMCTLIFYISMILWDSVAIFFLPSSSASRRLRRHKLKSSRIRVYPRHWIILSCYMSFGLQNYTMLSLNPSLPLCQSWTRANKISNIVELNIGVLVQYQSLRIHDLRNLYYGKLGEDTTLQAVPKFSPTIFPSRPTSSVTPHMEYELDYFDCEVEEHECFYDSLSVPMISSPDYFDISSICLPEIEVNCAHHTHADISPVLPLPSLSTAAFNATCMGDVNLYLNGVTGPSAPFKVIFDTGASLAISPDKNDFVGPISPLSGLTLGGLANGLNIQGIGTVKWKFRSSSQVMVITSSCYYVPGARAKLISPQRLFKSASGVKGKYTIEENNSTLSFEGVGDLVIDYDSRNHLPTALGKNCVIGGEPEVNLSGILDAENTNLTPSQKLLLHWHTRFGHKSMSRIQTLFRAFPFLSEKFKFASRCIIPLCETCQYAKAHRKPTNGSIKTPNPSTDGAIHANNLRAGSLISVDHFESRLKGRTYNSFGGFNADKFVGGCIFVDSMSGYLHVEHQLGFSSTETIRAKQNFEKLSMDHGVLVDSYKADNGVFKSNAFVAHIREHNQRLSYCGVNAHHKNGVAERAIRSVSECARALMLHAAVHWKDGISSELWPMAIHYATYIYNHIPNEQGIAPADLFTGVATPRHKLRDFHVWGAPVYVLDPTLQSGKKLPRWQPRSRRGLFVGFSPHHSSDVPLILNLRTGHISPQYHVVFDDEFSTVPSLASDTIPPSFWNAVDLEEHSLSIPLDASSTERLSPDWLTPAELEERSRTTVRQNQIRQSYQPTQPTLDPNGPNSHPVSADAPSHQSEEPLAMPLEEPSSSAPESSSSAPISSSLPITSQPPNLRRSPRLTPSSPRRSTRSTKGSYQTVKYTDEIQGNYGSVGSIPGKGDLRSHEALLAYQAELDTDLDTGEMHCVDPRAYAAKFKRPDADNPSYNMAMTGTHSNEYQQAMIKEVKQLIKQNTWSSLLRDKVPQDSSGKRRTILPGTWAFKLKRLPDGSPSKFKARYCVRGDKQIEGVDYFDTYAPVVQWSTVRLVLTMVLANSWMTRQVDYTNAFAQADLKEEVYIEPPKGFERKDKLDMVLKLIKSLYGLKQAPKSFYDKLSEGLIERGFTQSEMDKCLFMKKDMVCVIYVDDTIFAGPSSKAIEEVILSLGIAAEEQRHSFELRDEGEVGDFLGIRIEKRGPRQFTLTQTGLIAKVLKESNMESSNEAKTPAAVLPLGLDEDGDIFKESWDYATVMGMLMYLATNSRPDIAYAVNQCARFSHSPKDSHATGVKRILRYLNGTKDKGMTLSPTSDYTVDCYVDADFAGLWKVEDDQNPISVKSRTGFLIMFMGCPLLWVSKLQTQIALSTMESEYIALSHSMRELIGTREILKEIYNHVLSNDSGINDPTYTTISKTFGRIPQSKVHEDNEACLKFATMPKMSPRTKHIAIPYHFFRSKVSNFEIKVLGIHTNNQLADQFTKGLPQDKFVKDRFDLMGW